MDDHTAGGVKPDSCDVTDHSRSLGMLVSSEPHDCVDMVHFLDGQTKASDDSAPDEHSEHPLSQETSCNPDIVPSQAAKDPMIPVAASTVAAEEQQLDKVDQHLPPGRVESDAEMLDEPLTPPPASPKPTTPVEWTPSPASKVSPSTRGARSI